MKVKHKLIACDMDGVLADFDQYFIETYGFGPISADEATWDDFWNNDVPNNKAFENIKPESDALKLWDYLQSLPDDVVILTASNSSKCDKTDEQKYNWCVKYLKNFTSAAFYVCDKSSDKVKFLKNHPNTLLIDDNIQNCRDWIAAGNECILHRKTETTIKELINKCYK